MDIYVGPIPKWTTAEQLEREIASALHTPPVRRRDQGEINFAIKLATRSDGRPVGHAWLTIPEPTTANRFLEKCAAGKKVRPVQLFHEHRVCTLDFKINGFADSRKVQRLLEEPYRDPEARRRESEERRKRLEQEAQRQREGLRLREQRRQAAEEEERQRQRRQAAEEEDQRKRQQEEADSRRVLVEKLAARGERRRANISQKEKDKKGLSSPQSGHSTSRRHEPQTVGSSTSSAATRRQNGDNLPGSVSTAALNDIANVIENVSAHQSSFKSGDPARGPARKNQQGTKTNAYGRPGAWWSILFGVICPDGTFSVEDEERLAAPLPAALSEQNQSVIFGHESTNGVKILYNTLVRWSIHEQEVTFELDRPATFIRNGKVSTHWCFKQTKDDDPSLEERRRYRAPYVGSAFKVVFTSHEELDAFLLHAKRVFIRAGNLSAPRRSVRRGILRSAHFQALDSFCARLSIPLAFQVERLFLNGLLLPPDIHDLEGLVSRCVRERGESATAAVVMNLALSLQRSRAVRGTVGADEPLDLRTLFKHETKRSATTQRGADDDPLAIGLGATFEVYNATVTPTRVTLAGPVVDTSNRVLRLFPDHAHHFLRVSFTDEDFDRFPVGRRDLRDVDSESFVHERVGGTLKQGVTVAGRKWDMLAWSGSSLRTHQCWFSTPFTDDRGKRWTADLIRQALGDFSNVAEFPARYGARLSQAFSATAPTIKLDPDWIEVVDDVKSDSGHLFTDGVGQISPDLMKLVWHAYCKVKMLVNERRREVMAAKVPSALQVRLGGAKGVLCVNPQLKGLKVKLRPSMIKFQADGHNELEVATSSLHPLPTRLNRPLINALEDLGVDHDRFLALQRLAVQEVNGARRSFKAASELCKQYGFGSAFGSLGVFEKLHSLLGFAPEQLNSKGILNRLIATSIAAALGDLKRKARIPTIGPTLIGVADEFGFLKKDQVFAQVEEKDGSVRVVQGEILIGRSPTIHPGDTRMVRAVAPPKNHPLWQLRNVVVFSAEAKKRFLPSMLGGGDLDGDIYSLYEEPLLFINKNFNPGSYKQPPNKRLNRPCTVSDLADFFTDFVINDQIGIVSHLHLHISDLSNKHSLDPDCVKLAELHAQAVDFCKTGQAVHRRDLPFLPHRSKRPDYLAQNDHGLDVYPSKRALGRLYREIAWTDTDMPQGPTQVWLNADGDEVVPTLTSDLVIILDAIAEKFPYAKPISDNEEKRMQERCIPLLRSFTYHLSRIAAWVPESRHAAEWLREEEIILGAPVMATTSKLRRWQEKLQSATSELVPILKHQLGVAVTGGDPLAIQRTDKADVDAKLQHRSFGAGKVESALQGELSGGRSRSTPKAPRETIAERVGLLVDTEVDGERGAVTRDRETAEGELVPSFMDLKLDGMGISATEHGTQVDRYELEEIRGLFAASLLGARDVMSQSFGGSTFALVALGSLLNLIDAREAREVKRPTPLR